MKFFQRLLFAICLLAPIKNAMAYNGNLDYVICDIKRPLAGLGQAVIREDNYQVILDALKDKLQCNGLRVYIDLATPNPTHYSDFYKNVYTYARQLGMKLYTNPLGTGRQGVSNREFVDIIVSFANFFQPEFLGPFNETGLSIEEMKEIAKQVKNRLDYPALLVGPDSQQVRMTLNKISGSSDLEYYFDIIGSHNAEQDESATQLGWQMLAAEAKKPIWASENPRPWSFTNQQGDPIGINTLTAESTPVNGLVIYLAFPHGIDRQGHLTSFGQTLAAGLGSRE